MTWPNPQEFSSHNHHHTNSDAPKVTVESQSTAHTSHILTDYDHGWLDGFSAGVSDGRTTEPSHELSPSNPGELEDTHNEPDSSDATTSKVCITTRTIRGIRGPWGMIHPTN